MKRVDVEAVERVTAFLVAAQQSVSASWRGSLPHSWTALPELFASIPEFAAAAAALQRLGGDLTAADLAHTGVAALLGSGEQFDAKTVGTDLARYAARGDVERLELVGLNACDLPDGPVPVAGWELVRLGRSGVEDLMPVPAAARFMPRPRWDLTAAAATWWLRRFTGRKARCKGLILPFSGRALHERAPAPLLVLALADDAPLRPLSYFVVERGVAVHRTGGEELVPDPVPCGPGEQNLRPQFHDHDYYADFGGRRSQAQRSEWLRFCEVAGPMVERVYQKASAGHQGAARFARAAGQFLDVVMDARPDVPPRHQTVLGLSIALETLLLGAGHQSGVTEKFAARAALLEARKDAERADIHERAKALYEAGSDHRHGGELRPLYDQRDPHASQPPDDALNVADCPYLTRLLLHGLALLDSGTPDSVDRSLVIAQGRGEPSRRAR